MRSPEQVIALLSERKTSSGAVQSRMAEIASTYNGDLVIPLPELDKNERPAIANLAQVGIDQIGMRVASTMPNILFYPARPGIKKSEDKARLQRLVMGGWWGQNQMWSPNPKRMNTKLRRRSRWLAAYSCAPVMIRPGASGLPQWNTRNPLGAYPPNLTDPDDIVPPDCIFTYRRSRASLEREYPAQMGTLRKGANSAFDVIEYVDADQILCMVVGAAANDNNVMMTGGQGAPYVVLHDLPNRAGVPLVVAPGRVTLDRPLGQFDGIVGMYQLQGKMMALHVQAVQRGVFPDTWAVSGANGQVNVRVIADGLTGRIGEIDNGSIAQVSPQAGAYTMPTIDRVEYAERHEGGIPAEFGGSGSSNVRTGRRGDQILSATIDFRVQELQQILEISLEEEDRIAVAVAKAYAGPVSFSMYAPGHGQFSYTPNDIFDTDQHEVSYAFAGADINNLVITGGQRLGLETMSRESFMEQDPAIRDVEVEKDRIKSEQLDRAFWTSIQQMAADPNSPFTPADYARLHMLILTDKMDQYAAVTQIHQEIQQRQAAAAQGQLPPTEQAPGLAPQGAPGTASPQQVPAIAAQGPSMGNFLNMLATLRLPQRQGANG